MFNKQVLGKGREELLSTGWVRKYRNLIYARDSKTVPRRSCHCLVYPLKLLLLQKQHGVYVPSSFCKSNVLGQRLIVLPECKLCVGGGTILASLRSQITFEIGPQLPFWRIYLYRCESNVELSSRTVLNLKKCSQIK